MAFQLVSLLGFGFSKVYAGHMIGKQDRAAPGFPPEKEAAVREKIKKVIAEKSGKINRNYRGVAGGACGADKLFNKICEEIGILVELYLTLACDDFIVASVQFAMKGWVQRFKRLYSHLPYQVLSQKQVEANQNFAICPGICEF